jgi:hypothetical protein
LVDPAYSEPTLTTDTKESMVLESYRYVASYLPIGGELILPVGGADFDSALAIPSGELQVMAGRLVYPSSDYTGWSYPSQDPGRDYSSVYSSDPSNTMRRYIRAFNTGGVLDRGKIRIKGLIASDFAALLPISMGEVDCHPGGAIVQIMIPGVTGWLDLGLEDGQPDSTKTSNYRGCQVSLTEVSFETTVEYSTAPYFTSVNVEGKYLIFVRVTFIKNGIGEYIYLEDIEWLPS